ncbi:MAG: NUDIX domain-containing protein [Cyanobacteria bacterium SZAS TMP-1]|nr:NUDIX domain-containing protein [Cyanobacteria bacterium SZAS TMP-1]
MTVFSFIVAMACVVLAAALLFPQVRRLIKRLLASVSLSNRPPATDDHPPPAHFAGWKYCPLCASRLEEREVCERPRMACTNKRCHYVHWDNPKPVALCLVEVDGGLVLTRRRHPPRVGTWCIPGGFVEAHEAPETAAKRETWEETGLLVEITTLLGVYSPCQGGNEMVIVFGARPVGGALNKGEEVLELGVFKEADLPADIGFPQHLEIIQYWFKGDFSARGIDPPSNHCDNVPRDR